jgi:hypothetical protein
MFALFKKKLRGERMADLDVHDLQQQFKKMITEQDDAGKQSAINVACDMRLEFVEKYGTVESFLVNSSNYKKKALETIENLSISRKNSCDTCGGVGVYGFYIWLRLTVAGNKQDAHRFWGDLLFASS